MRITKRQLRKIIKEVTGRDKVLMSRALSRVEKSFQYALEDFIDVYDQSLGGAGPVSAIHSKVSDIVARTIDTYEEAASFGAGE